MRTVATHDTPKVVVVVLNWNGREDTLRCLESLRAVDYPNCEVLVVDNGSSDASVAAIRKRHPEVGVLETGKNLGFAGGNNVGIRAALDRDAEFILLLNNDTIAAPDLLSTFVQAAYDYRDAAVFGAKIYFLNEPQRLWYAGICWNPRIWSFEHVGEGTVDTGTEFEQVRDTEYACGCAMLLRASAVRTLGALDELFFLVFEEVDWCFRAREAGFRCLFVPKAKVWHRVGASFGGGSTILREYFHFRNRLLWAERHLPPRHWLGVLANSVTICFPLLGVGAMLGQFLRGRLEVRRAYWGTRQQVKEWLNELRVPSARMMKKVQRRALCDYVARRFGDCPSWIRAAASEAGQIRADFGDGPRSGSEK